MFLLFFLFVLCCDCSRTDPAMSWLAFASFAAPSEISFFSASSVVPRLRPEKEGAKPAFWIGLAPSAGTYLAQPINTKWLNSSYFAFVETYDWKSGVDFQSSKVEVAPGSKVYAEVAKVAPFRFRMAIFASEVWVNATVDVPSYVGDLVMGGKTCFCLFSFCFVFVFCFFLFFFFFFFF